MIRAQFLAQNFIHFYMILLTLGIKSLLLFTHNPIAKPSIGIV